jgi:hypothetical protein
MKNYGKKCNPDFFLFSQENQNDLCIKTCNEGYFNSFENEIKRCKICNPICKTCIKEKECLTCPKELYFNSDTKECLHSCPDNYLKSTINNQIRICEKCNDINCKVCQEKDVCLICNDKYLLHYLIETQGLRSKKKICVTNCPPSYSPSKDNILCI